MSHTPHLRDEDLLLSLDGWQPGEAAADAQVHLAECAGCRSRLQAFADTDMRVADTESNGDWTERTLRGRARARLEAELAGETQVERFATSLGWRAGPTTQPNRAITATLAVAIVALAVAGGASWRSRSSVAPASALVASTEEPDALPNRSFTPGATRALPVTELCGNIPWEPSPVPPSVRQEVLRNYRMEHVPDHEYELDYLVTPDLGGAPDPKNLWPERYGSRVWNARVKDQLEDLLPHLVCQGQVDLATAQHDIATNWIAAYKKYFRTNHPIGLSTRSFVASSANHANN